MGSVVGRGRRSPTSRTPVERRRVAERLERDQLAVVVEGQHVGALGRLAPELAGGEDDDLVALGDEVVRGGAEVLAHELPPQLAHGLLAVVGSGQRVLAGFRPRDRVVEVSHGALGVFVGECRVGILGILLVLLCAHLLPIG